MIVDSAKYTCAAGHDINEDSSLCRPERGIYIVADGLGGHSSGETASLAAVDYFDKSCLGDYTPEEVNRLLEEANTEVLNHGDDGKTTVAAAFIENGRFIYANVGDSRVYYFRKGKIIAVTKDHSVCQASVDMGTLRPEDIRGNEDRSRLLKVLGSEQSLNIKKRYPAIDIENGDSFLICSDGFWEYVYETEMEVDLLKSESAEQWLKYMLKRHILRAENKGDNYTAICGIIRFEDGDKAPAQKTVPVFSDTEAPKRKISPIILIAAAVIAVIAVCLVFLLRGNGSGDDNSTSEPSVSDTASSTESSSAAASSAESSSAAASSAESSSDTASSVESSSAAASSVESSSAAASSAESSSDTVSSADNSSDTVSSVENSSDTVSSVENPADTEDTSENISEPEEPARTA